MAFPGTYLIFAPMSDITSAEREEIVPDLHGDKILRSKYDVMPQNLRRHFTDPLISE